MAKEDITNASESSLNNNNVVTFSAITNASSYTTDNKRWLNEDLTIIVRLTTALSYSPQISWYMRAISSGSTAFAWLCRLIWIYNGHTWDNSNNL